MKKASLFLFITGFLFSCSGADYFRLAHQEAPAFEAKINDKDNDGVPDLEDNCVEIANPDQANNDEDEFGDMCDNCSHDTNSDQADIDSDGIGDACAAEECDGIDNDGDGLVDEGFDKDGDGHTTCSGDCNDSYRYAYPNAIEYCDEKDNDCDGLIDEQEDVVDTTDYYWDRDKDEFGDRGTDGLCASTCDVPPTNCITNNEDCRDDPSLDYITEFCDTSICNCDPNSGMSGDCDCSNSLCSGCAQCVNPGDLENPVIEVCDGIDNNCNGVLLATEIDEDGDGVMVCQNDCDDLLETCVYNCNIDEDMDSVPDCADRCFDKDHDEFGIKQDCFDSPNCGDEICEDGIDCDDNDPNEFPNQIWYKDIDGDRYSDGFISFSCERPANYYLNIELNDIQGDCADDDPNEFPGQTWYHDADGDGFTNELDTQTRCSDPDGTATHWVYTKTLNDCNDAVEDEFPGQTWYHDADGDGFTNELDTQTSCSDPDGADINWVYTKTTNDCNDNDPNEFPNQTWYHDADGDEFTNELDTQTRCSDPDGTAINWIYTKTQNDCDDNDPNEFPNQTWYHDVDGDGFTNELDTQTRCSDPDGAAINWVYTQTVNDCDDNDPNEFPNQIWYHDADEDGFTNELDTQISCSDPDGTAINWVYTKTLNDCDDNDENEFPNQIWYHDIDGDGFTNNLDTQIRCSDPDGTAINWVYTQTQNDCDDNDENEFPNQTWYHDVDGDGFTNELDTQTRCSDPDGAAINWVYTQTVNDCDDNDPNEFPNQIWYHDADEDGFTNELDTQISCSDPDGTAINWVYTKTLNDCDDNDPNEFPNQTWYHDVDGDGFTNELDAQTRCSDPDGAAINWVYSKTTLNDCDDNDPDVNPGKQEGPHGTLTCSDSKDNDCDNTIDVADTDCRECEVSEDCNDFLFCSGVETCDNGSCVTSEAPCQNDGEYCNGAESCNETLDQCENTENPCPENDGDFCNGEESCNETLDQCENTGNPCPENDGDFCNGVESCNETLDQCENTDDPCPENDGDFCNGVESCNETLDQCENTDDPCPENDGDFCNGVESCNETFDQCENTGDPCPENDGDYCNGEESCNETLDQCENTGDPCPENDGDFCNGVESCNETLDQCENTGDPCPENDGDFCNGIESCNETLDQCENTGNPCTENDGNFCNGVESCNETLDQCENTGDPCPENDGDFCNGIESCNETLDRCENTGDPCPENDGDFCNGVESCNETLDQCENTGDPCEFDGIYCNGEEFCNETLDQCETTVPCPDHECQVCVEGINGTGTCEIIDFDDDGFGDENCGGDDCNDNNSLSYPFAPEQCDGEDNNCDTIIPNDAIYGEIDDDLDEYVECSSWIGSAINITGGGDCNDSDPITYPGALEQCDGNDNNCENGITELDENNSDEDVYLNCEDNCPTITNPSQVDYDGDGAGYECDLPQLRFQQLQFQTQDGDQLQFGGDFPVPFQVKDEQEESLYISSFKYSIDDGASFIEVDLENAQTEGILYGTFTGIATTNDWSSEWINWVSNETDATLDWGANFENFIVELTVCEHENLCVTVPSYAFELDNTGQDHTPPVILDLKFLNSTGEDCYDPATAEVCQICDGSNITIQAKAKDQGWAEFTMGLSLEFYDKRHQTGVDEGGDPTYKRVRKTSYSLSKVVGDEYLYEGQIHIPEYFGGDSLDDLVEIKIETIRATDLGGNNRSYSNRDIYGYELSGGVVVEGLWPNAYFNATNCSGQIDSEPPVLESFEILYPEVDPLEAYYCTGSCNIKEYPLFSGEYYSSAIYYKFKASDNLSGNALNNGITDFVHIETGQRLTYCQKSIRCDSDPRYVCVSADDPSSSCSDYPDLLLELTDEDCLNDFSLIGKCSFNYGSPDLGDYIIETLSLEDNAWNTITYNGTEIHDTFDLQNVNLVTTINDTDPPKIQNMILNTPTIVLEPGCTMTVDFDVQMFDPQMLSPNDPYFEPGLMVDGSEIDSWSNDILFRSPEGTKRGGRANSTVVDNVYHFNNTVIKAASHGNSGDDCGVWKLSKIELADTTGNGFFLNDDLDGDNIPNNIDDDIDGDGWEFSENYNYQDLYPYCKNTECPDDPDQDGVFSGDNCPLVPNPYQEQYVCNPSYDGPIYYYKLGGSATTWPLTANGEHELSYDNLNPIFFTVTGLYCGN